MSPGITTQQLCRQPAGSLGATTADAGTLLILTAAASVLVFDTVKRVRPGLRVWPQISSHPAAGRSAAMPAAKCLLWPVQYTPVWLYPASESSLLYAQTQVASWELLDTKRLTLACPAVCSAAQDICHAVATAAGSGQPQTLLSWPFSQHLGSLEKLATRTALPQPAHSVHILSDASAWLLGCLHQLVVLHEP